MASLSQYSVMSLPYSFRNKIINGAMLIDQRRNGASQQIVTGINHKILDKWCINIGGSNMNLTTSRSTDAPEGFSNSLSITNNTIVNPVTNPNMYCLLLQRIENTFTDELKYGTEDAKPITISFWVKSSITGYYPIRWWYQRPFNNGNTEYRTSFYIDLPNVWEKKTITIPGNKLYKNYTSYELDTPDIGAVLEFVLACGNNLRSTPTTPAWSIDDGTKGYTGQAHISQTVGITFKITGVQVEARATATPFEWRPYGLEFLMCQRYYNRPSAYYEIASQSLAAYHTYTFPIQMTGTPTASAFTTDTLYPGQTVDLITPYSARVKTDSSTSYKNVLVYLDTILS